MGFRFRKSFKIAPGVRLNVGKKSSSVSFGVKGLRTTVSTSGKRTHTVGIPGTGISHVSTSGGKKSRATAARHTTAHQQPASSRLLRICSKIMLVIAILALFLAVVGFSTSGSVGIVFLIVALPCLFFWWLWK